MSLTECIYCNSTDKELVSSYKHNWIVCADCQNISRELKISLPLDFLKFFSNIFPRAISKQLWHEDKVQKDNRIFYDYYDSAVFKQSIHTKWEGQLNNLEDKFKKCNLILEGPVLDVSGGPGFFVKELMSKGIFAVATEFSERAVISMREVLGIHCVPYDYNSHLLSNQVDKRKFKTVFIRSSINFCKDLSKFCLDLHTIVDKEGTVYVDFALPTLGACLRWQHDEYTYERLWHPHTVRQYFEIAGFRLVNTKAIPSFHSFTNKCLGFGKNGYSPKILLKSLFTVFFTLPYYLKGRKSKAINRSMHQKGIEYIFKKV